jgi:hypothetical protein
MEHEIDNDDDDHMLNQDGTAGLEVTMIPF